jgi:hypothetical protein
MVGHLVVARERRVYGGDATEHVLQHREHDEVAHEHAHRRTHQRIDAAAVPARLHVAPALAGGGDQLEQDLPCEQHHGAGHVRPVREERSVPGIRCPLVGEPADGEQGAVGLAGEQVAAAGARGQQADAARVPALDLSAVVRVRAGHHRGRLLLHPPERRYVLVGAEQYARLAGARL